MTLYTTTYLLWQPSTGIYLANALGAESALDAPFGYFNKRFPREFYSIASAEAAERYRRMHDPNWPAVGEIVVDDIRNVDVTVTLSR